MKISLKKYFILFISILLCQACANIQRINGGPEDKTAPSILKQLSSPNEALNVQSKSFTFTFDEWVTVNNPTQNIVITPTTKYPLITKLKGRKLTIAIDPRDTLKENTTYNIFLGDAIKDITNNNIATNLRYVFATGDYIDSMFVSGVVIDAATHKPVIKSYVTLYNNLSDTAFKTSRPDYFTLTDSSGRFQIKNLKTGIYNIYSIADKNLNYYYDQKSEAIAFLKDSIILNDKNLFNISLKMSTERAKNSIKDKKNLDGLLKLIYTNSAENVKISCDPCTNKQLFVDKDSLWFWYDLKDTSIAVISYESRSDSITLLPTQWNKKDFKTKVSRITKQVVPGQNMELYFSEPIVSFDTNAFSFNQNISFGIQKDSLDQRKLIISPREAKLEALKLIIKDSSILGIHNAWAQKDTISLNVIAQSSLSRLKLTIDSNIIGQNYILQVLSNEKIIEQSYYKAESISHTMNFNKLFPGSYDVKIIEDNNLNGIWDPVNYQTKTLPEEIHFFKLSDLRADWDLELKLKLK